MSGILIDAIQVIQVDVDHIQFCDARGEGQANLRKVLRAYALYNPELGYCQGMGMLVGLLLMRMPPQVTFIHLGCLLDASFDS